MQEQSANAAAQAEHDRIHDELGRRISEEESVRGRRPEGLVARRLRPRDEHDRALQRLERVERPAERRRSAEVVAAGAHLPQAGAGEAGEPEARDARALQGGFGGRGQERSRGERNWKCLRIRRGSRLTTRYSK